MAASSSSTSSAMARQTPSDDGVGVVKTKSIENVEIAEVAQYDGGSGPAVQSTATPMPKNAFSPLGALALAFTVLNSWVVLVVGLGSGLLSGGPSALVWGFVYAGVCNMAIVLSLGEIFAVFPTAGGQYHWAAILSPPRFRASLSWATGMMNVIALWIGAATVGYLSSVLIISAILVNDPDYVSTPGKQYAIFVAVTLSGPAITIIAGPRVNRYIDQFMTFISVGGLLSIVITLLAMSKPKASASFVFAGTNNATGWDSMSIAWLLGILQSAFAFLGFDLIFHISEEMPNPRKEGPKMLNMCIIVSTITGLLALLAMLFCVSDLDSLVGTSYGLPFAQLCINATNSEAATTIFLLIPTLLLMNSSRGISLTASRVLMSLGRDKVLPYSEKFMVVKYGEPIWGMILSCTVPLLCGLVQLGPSAAFNSLLGTSTIMFEITYTLPAVLMLCGGRKLLNRDCPSRAYNLGRWGVICNLIACFFTLEACVVYCFPAGLPVSASSMNYVVVFVSFFGSLLAGIWFFWARKSFAGPDRAAIEAIANRTDGESNIEEM